MDVFKLTFPEMTAMSSEQQRQAVKTCRQQLLALRMDIYSDSSKQKAKKQTLRKQVARLKTAQRGRDLGVISARGEK